MHTSRGPEPLMVWKLIQHSGFDLVRWPQGPQRSSRITRFIIAGLFSLLSDKRLRNAPLELLCIPPAAVRFTGLERSCCLLQLHSHREREQSASVSDISKSSARLICSYLKLRDGSAGFFPFGGNRSNSSAAAAGKLARKTVWKQENGQRAVSRKQGSLSRSPSLLPGDGAALLAALKSDLELTLGRFVEW